MILVFIYFTHLIKYLQSINFELLVIIIALLKNMFAKHYESTWFIWNIVKGAQIESGYIRIAQI